MAKVYEEDRDADASRYSPNAAREESWGPVSRRREHSYQQWKSAGEWEYVDGAWNWKKSPRKEGGATISEDTRKLGFGEYDEWTYVELITQAMICAGSSRRNQCPMTGADKMHRLDPMKESRNRNGCKHGGSRMESEERAYHRGRIWILDNPQVISRGKPFSTKVIN